MEIRKMVLIGMASTMALSMCACGSSESASESVMKMLTPSSYSEDANEEALTEEAIQETLNALDAENEKEEAERKAAEAAEEAAEEAAMEEAKATITDYSQPNISLTDIDPVSTGAGEMVGLDFSTFPTTNGSFNYTWNYSSYSDEPEISSVSGEAYETAKWYKLTLEADGSMYSNFKKDVITWLESQNLIAESNMAVNDPGNCYGGSYYWLGTDKAVAFKIDGREITFKTYYLNTYHYEGTFYNYQMSSSWLKEEALECVSVKPNEDIEEAAAGSTICYMYIDPVTEEGYDHITYNGAKPLGGTDLTQYISIDSDLEEGDLVSVDVVSISAIKASACSYLVDGEDFLALSIHKIG